MLLLPHIGRTCKRASLEGGGGASLLGDWVSPAARWDERFDDGKCSDRLGREREGRGGRRWVGPKQVSAQPSPLIQPTVGPKIERKWARSAPAERTESTRFE